MDKESVKNFIRNVDTQLFEIVNNLVCSICQEIFNKPVTTPCGHSFCGGCIKRVLSSKTNSGCPLCKNPVKRYGLKADEAKSTFSEICKELPLAFEKDVRDLTQNITTFDEDLVKSSKLSQLYNQDSVRDSKTTKQKSRTVKKAKKRTEVSPSENDSGSFCPVLKRAENVLEYVSAKKKRMDDLVSISQTEPASNSSLGESSEVNKKLEGIEKIKPEEKINEWFNAAGDNIYINSPGLSIMEPNGKNESGDEKEKSNQQTMIRRDYNKSGVSSHIQTRTTILVNDPYEFVPSQNCKGVRKRRQKRSSGRKIPDFRALQSFSKESIKRNAILLDTGKEDNPLEPGINEEMGDRVTASQKFERLLQESKEEPKKSHVLYSASQSSSPQFLDVSLKSKTESTQILKTPKSRKKLLCDEDILFKNVECLTGGKQRRSGGRGKRKRSSDASKSTKKQKLSTRMTEESHTTPEIDKTREECPTKDCRKMHFPPTKLGELLKELVDDDIIYATVPENAPVRLPDLVKQQAGATVTQNTELIGFCTQEECPNEKNFKKLVENIEKELDSSEYIIEDPEPKSISPSPKPQTVSEKLVTADENGNCKSEPIKGVSVAFLHLGKLTPIRKRAKSTVVKVVFPIGLGSLARRHVLQTNYVSPAPIPRKQTRQVSTGIQTSQQQPVSCLVQTSQVQQCSVTMQTSQEEKPSVEVQTTQKLNASAEVQTSQRLVCQEIQTSQRLVSQEIQTTQIDYESAQVQTTQLQLPQTVRTPHREPSHPHQKVIKKKKSEDTSPLFPTLAIDDLPGEKEVVMDFDVEEEFERTWRKTQKKDDFVERKNLENIERNRDADAKQVRVDSGNDESDIQPPRRRSSFRILSEESILDEYETRQKIPLSVQKVSQEEMEVIQLDSPKTPTSDEQMKRVLKNIDLDMPKGRNSARNEKEEESDSDFFVEQTPPRPSSRAVEDPRNVSKSRSILGLTQKNNENNKSVNFDGLDLIGDSIPKGFSESFLTLTNSQKPQPTCDKNPKEVQKMSPKVQPTVDLPNENDQNQINAFEEKPKETKVSQLRAVVDGWTKSTPHKKLCIIASSVKNPEMIKKFANKFKVEYVNKPTKDMTHLIVGLHENEEKELLPLCTPKLLFAMANRKWVVSEQWAESCLRVNSLLPEESFETLDPIGGCGCKKARVSGEKLLRNCEIFLLGEFQMISKEELADLIVDCGGTLVPTLDRFSFSPSKLRMIVADRDCLKLSEKQLQDLHLKHSTAILSRDVIIMSIQSYKLANFWPYLLHPTSEESLLRLGYPEALVRNDDDVEEDSPDSAR